MEAAGLASGRFPEAAMGARRSSMAGVMPMAAAVVTAILVGSAMFFLGLAFATLGLWLTQKRN